MLGQFYALVYLEPNQNRGCWSRFIHIAHFGLALLAHDALLVGFPTLHRLLSKQVITQYVCMWFVAIFFKKWFESILFHSILGAPNVNRILQMKISMSGAWRSIAFTAQEDVDNVDPGWRGCYDECVSGVLLVSFPIFVYVCVNPRKSSLSPSISLERITNPEQVFFCSEIPNRLLIRWSIAINWKSRNLVQWCSCPKSDFASQDIPRGCLKSTFSIICGRFW